MKLLIVDANGKEEIIFIDLSMKIGEGATALIYKANISNELWAAKIYKPERIVPAEKLEAMLQTPPENINIIHDNQIFIQYTWVKYLLKDIKSKKIVGFIMPLVDQNSTNSLDTYYDPVLIKRLSGIAQSALSFRLEIAKNLCELVNNLHKLGHYFIDIKPQNIRVYKDNNSVVLMDCDGFSIKNIYSRPDRFPADLISTDFIAPEVLKNHLSPKSLGEAQDRYGLAVILFELLNGGTHPFQGIVTDASIQVSTNDERASLGLYPHGILTHLKVKPRPQSIHDLLPVHTRRLFDQAFTSLNRPSANEWLTHFDYIFNSKMLVRCTSYPNDVRHIHFKDMGCIGCRILSQKSGNNPPTNPRKYQVQPAQVVSSLQPVTASNPSSNSFQPNNNKSKILNKPPQDLGGSNFWVIFILLIFFGAIFIYLTSDENNQENTNYPTSNPSSTPSQVYICSSLNIPMMTTDQICKFYHGDVYPSCNPLFSAQLVTRERKLFPVHECGQDRSSISNNTPNSNVTKPITIEKKIKFLSNVSNSSVISYNSLGNNPDALGYFYDVNNDIIDKLEIAVSFTDQGKLIYNNANIANISRLIFDGHNGDCSTPSLGITEICLIKNNTVICEYTNKNISYKMACLSSFSIN